MGHPFARIFFLPVTVLLLSCGNNPPAKKPVYLSVPAEHIVATKDQQDRRMRSEAYCTVHEVPVYINPNSMFTDAESSVTIRTKDEIADRAIGLFYAGMKSGNLEPQFMDEMNQKFDAVNKLTQQEKEFIFAPAPTPQQTANADWGYESLHVLLWALGYIDSLDYPSHTCDVDLDTKIMFNTSDMPFREQAKLRSKQEILDQADLILRLHWACVEARLANKAAPGKLNEEVVMERHRALNWLIRYGNAGWDEVPTDT
ncbi:DUF4272 domain-containing protein [Chitinophaga agrisoli]|uniref:DUF4272 domain-containing protein n=1 Tax=Chitinophaga agrisoli TaxID=2607653 RepID=A0A5B2VUZ4_9BACT|nr:DUF4272 domain-containing protein [Chitinophaga agrisoli]KAA2242604.1 DUF4272 domain-containing protein [Chitinophaga agrisoli]